MAFEDRAVASRSSTCEYVNVGLFNVDEPCVFPHPFLFFLFFFYLHFPSLTGNLQIDASRAPASPSEELERHSNRHCLSDLAVLHAW
jgi:hypothetical protein